MYTFLVCLLKLSYYSDVDESNIGVNTFEAVSVIIQNTVPDCIPLLFQLISITNNRSTRTIVLLVLTNNGKETKNCVEGLLYDLILVALLKSTKEQIMSKMDALKSNLLHVLQLKDATYHEEVFSTNSAIYDKLEAAFKVS